MLVLSRMVGEKVRIGKDVVVEVLGLPGTRVKLGFTAPQEIKILRDELQPPEEPTHAPQPVPQAA